MGRKPVPRPGCGFCAHQKHPGLLQAPSFRLICVILQIRKTRATIPLAPEHLSLAQLFLYWVTPAAGGQRSPATAAHPMGAGGLWGIPMSSRCSRGINLLLPPASAPVMLGCRGAMPGHAAVTAWQRHFLLPLPL